MTVQVQCRNVATRTKINYFFTNILNGQSSTIQYCTTSNRCHGGATVPQDVRFPQPVTVILQEQATTTTTTQASSGTQQSIHRLCLFILLCRVCAQGLIDRPSKTSVYCWAFLVDMLEQQNPQRGPNSRFRRTFFIICAAMAAAILIVLHGPLLTLLDKSLPVTTVSKSSTSMSRLRNDNGELSTGTPAKKNPRVDDPLSTRSSASSSSSLRFDWSNLPLHSPLARAMQAHQSDCSVPLGDLRMRNAAGLGSDLHLWTQALCNGMQENARVQTQLPWIFRDSGACSNHSQETAMLCYFPHSELRCPDDRKSLRTTTNRTRLYVGTGMVKKECGAIRKRYRATFSDVRAAGIEYLFSQTGPLLIEEAERQMTQVFGDERPLPSQLITVHIRWGDKKSDMKLLPIQDYVDAVQNLSSAKNLKGPEVNIFLASEDPLAVQGFQEAAKAHQWKVFVDAYYQIFQDDRRPELNGNPHMSKKLQGRPGLVALASVMIALQANSFVLTTRSNWSRLINEMRKNILDPQCDSCSQMIDLTKIFFEW